MRTKLIQALRDAADEVEQHPQAYDWFKMGKCACGIVAQHALNLGPEEIQSLTDQWRGVWQHVSAPQTKLLINTVIAGLLSVGMTERDFACLERGDHPEVLNRLINPSQFDITRPENFVIYARTWADILEEE